MTPNDLYGIAERLIAAIVKDDRTLIREELARLEKWTVSFRRHFEQGEA